MPFPSQNRFILLAGPGILSTRFPVFQRNFFSHFLTLSPPGILLQEGTWNLGLLLVPNNEEKGGEIRIKNQYRGI